MECKGLEEVRANIDRIDHQIIELIAERKNYVCQASKFKKDTAAVQAPKRVEAVIEKVRSLARDNDIDENLVEAVYRTMITQFVNLEMKEFESKLEGKE